MTSIGTGAEWWKLASPDAMVTDDPRAEAKPWDCGHVRAACLPTAPFVPKQPSRISWDWGSTDRTAYTTVSGKGYEPIDPDVWRSLYQQEYVSPDYEQDPYDLEVGDVAFRHAAQHERADIRRSWLRTVDQLPGTFVCRYEHGGVSLRRLS